MIILCFLPVVPEKAPESVNAVAVNSTAIRFTWIGPPANLINGINQGYKVRNHEAFFKINWEGGLIM